MFLQTDLSIVDEFQLPLGKHCHDYSAVVNLK